MLAACCCCVQCCIRSSNNFRPNRLGSLASNLTSFLSVLHLLDSASKSFNGLVTCDVVLTVLVGFIVGFKRSFQPITSTIHVTR